VAQGFAATQGAGASEDRFAQALAQRSYLPGICFKYHAACFMTHSSIEAIRALRVAERFATEDVRAVELTVNEGHFGVCNIPAPRTGLEAKFSLRFTAAMALAGRDTAGIKTYTDALARDPELVALRDRVTVVAWPQPRAETRVRIQLGDRACEHETNVGVPATDLDAQWRSLVAKFHALVDPRLGRDKTERLVETCRHLEQASDLTTFFESIRGTA
jgi:2-methylcitrate dehydratase PrpD